MNAAGLHVGLAGGQSLERETEGITHWGLGDHGDRGRQADARIVLGDSNLLGHRIGRLGLRERAGLTIHGTAPPMKSTTSSARNRSASLIRGAASKDSTTNARCHFMRSSMKSLLGSEKSDSIRTSISVSSESGDSGTIDRKSTRLNSSHLPLS